MPRFNSINFYQNRHKIKLFLRQKRKIFLRWGLRPQTSVPPAGTLPPDPRHSPPIVDFCIRAWLSLVFKNYLPLRISSTTVKDSRNNKTFF